MSAPNREGMGLGDDLLVWRAIGFIVVFGLQHRDALEPVIEDPQRPVQDGLF